MALFLYCLVAEMIAQKVDRIIKIHQKYTNVHPLFLHDMRNIINKHENIIRNIKNM